MLLYLLDTVVVSIGHCCIIFAWYFWCICLILLWIALIGHHVMLWIAWHCYELLDIVMNCPNWSPDIVVNCLTLLWITPITRHCCELPNIVWIALGLSILRIAWIAEYCPSFHWHPWRYERKRSRSPHLLSPNTNILQNRIIPGGFYKNIQTLTTQLQRNTHKCVTTRTKIVWITNNTTPTTAVDPTWHSNPVPKTTNFYMTFLGLSS